MLEQRIRVPSIGREQCHADPGVDPGEVAIQVERLRERGRQAFAQRRRPRRVLDIALDHRELVGAQARERVGIAQGGEQARARMAQQKVARGAAEGGVDALEVDQIEGQHSNVPAAPAPVLENRLQPRKESVPIG
jgi:hypothetical protein